jgi:hypothetical protein
MEGNGTDADGSNKCRGRRPSTSAGRDQPGDDESQRGDGVDGLAQESVEDPLAVDLGSGEH